MIVTVSVVGSDLSVQARFHASDSREATWPSEARTPSGGGLDTKATREGQALTHWGNTGMAQCVSGRWLL